MHFRSGLLGCKEHQDGELKERRLLASYMKATRFYSLVSIELERQRGTIPRAVYNKVLKVVGRAREDREKARVALERFRNKNPKYSDREPCGAGFGGVRGTQPAASGE
jgi:hypothetical protein